MQKSEYYRLRLVPWLSLPTEAAPRDRPRSGTRAQARERSRQVFELVEGGMPSDDVAERYGITELTVRRIHAAVRSRRADA